MNVGDFDESLGEGSDIQGQAELVEKNYAHIRCPEHGGSTMAEPDPAEEGSFFYSYCCEKLQDLVHAERASSG